ncbi:MAG: deoxyribodipyrimidine photo-lyase [Bryobacteraceae bacterium]
MTNQPTPALLWFRLDLRLSDNPALAASLARGGAVLPVFIWAPEEEGAWPPGAASRWWLHQSLTALSLALELRGSRLIVRRGPSARTLEALASETGAGAVFWNRRYEPAVIERDAAVKTALRARGLSAESFNGNLLHEPWTILNAAGQPYRVFTPFWHACMKAPIPLASAVPPAVLPPVSQPYSLPLADLELEPAIDWAAGLREVWRPGEEGAREHLRRFQGQDLSEYPLHRDRPDLTGTSRLSPHLHFGEISPGDVLRAIMTNMQADPKARESYRRQLVWREFAYHLLYHFPATAEQPMRSEFAKFPWRMQRSWFDAWKRGATGYPLADAGMRELWHTGWMHNRLRMVTASFLVKHLLISWQDGAKWFWDTLVDADLANNTFGWQWVAGCGADAAPYFRIFNPTLQAAKFDPDGAYVRHWIPEVESAAYPRPIVDRADARAAALHAWEELPSSPLPAAKARHGKHEIV